MAENVLTEADAQDAYGETIPDTVFTPIVSLPARASLESTLLPLRPVTFDLTCRPEEIGSGIWPPERFSARNERLQLLNDFWYGKLNRLLPEADPTIFRVTANRFRVDTSDVVNLLMLAPIETNWDQIGEDALRDTTSALLTDQVRYGGAILVARGKPLAGGGGVELLVIDPRCYYPCVGGGWVVVRPYVSDVAQSDLADRAHIIVAQPDGTAESSVWDWAYTDPIEGKGTRTGLGKRLEEPTDWGLAFSSIIPKSPVVEAWGTPVFEDLAPLMLDAALIRGIRSSALIDNLRPCVVASVNLKDAQRLTLAEGTIDENDRRALIRVWARAVKEMLRSDVPIIVPEILGLDYLQAGTGPMDVATEHLAELGEEMSRISGLPALFYEGGGQSWSGVAMKEAATPFYGRTVSMVRRTSRAYEAVLNPLRANGETVTVGWEHYFDYRAAGEVLMPTSDDLTGNNGEDDGSEESD